MIKKKYMILALGIVSALLGGLIYDNITLHARAREYLPVEITNLPLDEEGNLRVTHEPSWKVISAVEDFNLTWAASVDHVWDYSDKIDVGSVFVGDYSRMKVYMGVRNFTLLNQSYGNIISVTCYLTSIFDYGEINVDSFEVFWMNRNTPPPKVLFAEYPRYPGNMRVTVEPSLRFTIQGKSWTYDDPAPSISCLVSIGIYLRNE